MSNEIEQFTQAVQSRHIGVKQSNAAQPYTYITVLGGGIEAQALAALCLAQDKAVTLFSAYAAELTALRTAGSITLRGEGPVGTFQLDQAATPSIQTTAQLDTAVANADLIFLTGPVHKQRTYGMVLADHLTDGQTLVVLPGRTFSAFETDWLLHVGGCAADVTIIEMLSLPYRIRLQDKALHLSACCGVASAALPGSRVANVDRLQVIFPNIEAQPSAIFSSFADASGAVECVALLLGGSHISAARVKLPEGAVALEERQTFYSLLDSDHCQTLLRQLLDERRAVARRFGVRELSEPTPWIERFAGTTAGSGSRNIPGLKEAQAVLRCAVIGSLVPLQSAGRLVGVTTPITDAVICLVSATLGQHLATAGRQLGAMGLHADCSTEARKGLESIARGRR